MKHFIVFLLFAVCFNLIYLRAETYVVCVGIANYASPNVTNLSNTEKDAKSIASFFKKGTGKVTTITGKYATRTQIIKTIKAQFAQAKAGDKIILFFSGHGYPGGFCPYDMTRIQEGLTYEEVLKVMKDSKASNKFIFADACFSGKIRNKNRGKKTDFGNILFFLSSRDNEESIESPFLANGYFTKFLLQGLKGGADSNKDKKITASELFKFVNNGVREQSRDRQHPVMWGNFPDDLVIVQYTK